MLPRTHVNTKPLTKSSLPYILDILWRRSTWNPHTDLYTLSPPKEHCITGLRWWSSGDENGTMMCDTRLPFGSRKSPSIFNRITQAVVRAMNSRGYDTLAYLDDFIVTGSDFHSSKAALDALMILLRSLGFQINWAKIQDPSQSVTFLEVNIDSIAGELSLKPEKLQEVQAIIRDFQRRCRASRKQLERLAGKLIWASRVTPWGRSHVKSVYSLILTLRLPGHKGLLVPIQWDLTWWATWLSTGRNRRCIWPLQTTLDVYSISQELCTRFLLCCALLWLYIDWFSHIHQAYFTGTVAI